MSSINIPIMQIAVRDYIKSSWLIAVKKKDVDKNFLLPYDYIPPCIEGDLINLYYWDTYFTNLGLYLDGLTQYAFNNIENLKYCLQKFNCVPNMCRLNGADYASQPPLLFMMVADYFKHTGDIVFLKNSYEALCKEYVFWQTKRISPNGLAKYGTNQQNEEIMVESANDFSQRTGMDVSSLTVKEKIEMFHNRVAEGESGEDHTPRFQGKANEVNPIDLNSYLYLFEKTMSYFANIISRTDEVNLWMQRSIDRKNKIFEFCYDAETGLFFDYNYVTKQKSYIVCAACYLPFIAEISSDVRAVEYINNKLLLPYGVASCVEMPSDGLTYQWGYPNIWAPHNYLAYSANKKVNNKLVSSEIAKRYLNTVAKEFTNSKKLYEKYDGLIGGPATLNEYGTPEMLGWTAGVYNYFYDDLYKK